MPKTATLRPILAAIVAAAFLAGCGSSVKLDDKVPVESRTPTAAPGAEGGAGGAAGAAGAAAGASSQSRIAGVDLTQRAGGPAPDDLPRTVYFDFDSFVVKDEYRSLIDAHARRLAANRGQRMVIEGHTDERGGREYNLALGQKRAEAVLKSLALLGAQESQLEAVSYGEERPVEPGRDEAAWAKNRRAELKDR